MSISRRIGPAVIWPLLALTALAMTGCGGSGGDSTTRYGETARAISNEELGQMVLKPNQFLPDYATFQPGAKNGALTFEARVAQARIDPDTERAKLEKFGWMSGYDAEYSDPQVQEKKTGVSLVDSQVDLHATASGASGYFQQAIADLTQQVGKTHNNITLTRAEQFEVHIADEAAGGRAEFSARWQDGSFLDLWAIQAGFRRGRVLGTVTIVSFAPSDPERARLESQATYLAGKLNDQFAAVLAGVAPK